jgi:alanine racemase
VSARPRLTVDLDALAANYRRLADEAPAAEIAAVVKADGYGLGLAPVARTLFAAGARRFFVADVEEGRDLAAILPAAVVYVLAGFAVGTREAFRDRRLRPVLNTPGQIRAFAELARRERPAAALQVDSGMTRLGVSLEALDGLRHTLADLELDFLVSHLANSAGIFLGPDFSYDLCRPGIALYGGNPRPGRANPMAPVVELDAQILQVYALEAEARVGYGATFRAPAGARIATAALGYADGVLRCTGNRATAQLAGIEIPVAGRVSMDLVGLDVTNVPTTAALEGARVKLIWGAGGVDRMADAAGTIPYEVLVRLGARVERRYRGGA